MDLSHWIWLATAAYGLHAFEEYMLDWRDWARAVIGLPVAWADFYVVNFLVIVLGIVAANLATAAPGVALGFPALMVVNAVFFHILPVVRTGGRFSPGLMTAIILFLPIAVGCYWAASEAGALDAAAAVGSVVLGAALMAMPILLFKIRDRPYFKQT